MANNYSKNVLIRLQTIVKGNKEVKEMAHNFKAMGGDLENVTKGVVKSAIKQGKALDGMTKKGQFYDEWTKKLGTNQEGLAKIMQASGFHFNKSGDVVDKGDRIQRDYGKTLEANAFQARKFEMAQLGIMFGGMALNRAMSNLNSTSREWLGINELMSTAMGIVTLPAAMDLLEFGVIPLFDALTNLPEGAQKAIGYTTLALEGLGGVMMVGGQLMLGMDAFTRTFEKMSGTTMVSGISGMKKGLQKAFNSDFAKGIGVVGAVSFIVSDILLEESGDFEWDEKLGAAAFIGLARGGGLAARLKGGVVVFTVLVAIEGIMDPEATGKVMADVINFFQSVNDMLQDGIKWLIKTWDGRPEFLGGTGAGFAEMPTSFKEWGQKFKEGYSSEMESLDESGSLTRGLEGRYGSIDYAPVSESDIQNIFSGGQTESPFSSGGGNQGMSFSPTYNVQLSDKSEFERMLSRRDVETTQIVRSFA